jgi:Tol biopolymer transport system component
LRRRESLKITPTWSPDGSQIMFALDPIADDFQHPSNGIYVIDATVRRSPPSRG